MPPDEDDGRKAEHISTAVDRTLAEIIRKNVEKRISGQRTIVKRAKTQEEIVAATLAKNRTEVVRHAAFTEVRPIGPSVPYMDAKQAEDRMHRRPVQPVVKMALIPITLRLATELPFPAVSFKLNGAVFVSVDLRVWRATTQYDRLVARFTPETPEAARSAIFKSLTSPTVLPRNVTLIKPPNFTFVVVPPPVVTPPKKDTP